MTTDRASANAIPMTFWNIIEIFSQQGLPDRVRKELEGAIVRHVNGPALPQQPLGFDMAGVMSSPLLQSIYAEALRMHASLMLTRSPTSGDHRIGDFVLPKGGLICIPADLAASDEALWGRERTARPLAHFWAERFLVTERGEDGTETAHFSTKGLDGAWIPYGGGALICPGRHLSKLEMIGGVAVFAAYFQIDMSSGVPPMDHAFFGLGAQPPAGAVPVRLRRRVGLGTSST